MPPKIKIDKQTVAAAALEIVRRLGLDALNARAVAEELHCSTQPIFSNFASMQELKETVIRDADQLYQQYIDKALRSTQIPPYKASGIAYIQFARDEKNLFQLLFMRNRAQEEIREEKESLAPLLRIISKNTGLSEQEAYLFHMEMWVYAHGIASMIATGYLNWEEEMAGAMLTDVYEGVKQRYQSQKGGFLSGSNCDTESDQTL